MLQSDIDYELTTEQVEEGVSAYQEEGLGLADWGIDVTQQLTLLGQRAIEM